MPNDAWRDRIVLDPLIQGGEPVIRGTRVRVSVIIANLADMTLKELLEHYPQLDLDDVRAAVKFASEACRDRRVA